MRGRRGGNVERFSRAQIDSGNALRLTRILIDEDQEEALLFLKSASTLNSIRQPEVV